MLSSRLLRSVCRVSSRGLATSRPAQATFTVQDEEEFKEKVMGAAGPVVVIFLSSHEIELEEHTALLNRLTSLPHGVDPASFSPPA